MNDQAWTDNPKVLLDRRVLAHLVDEPSKMNYPDVAAALEADDDEVARAFLSLEANGLVKTGDHRASLKYPHSAVATPSGRSVAAGWQAKGTAGMLKRECIAAMLAWLDANDGERLMGTDAFMGDVRSFFYAQPFPEAVIVEAAKALKEANLIKGTGTWGGLVMRPAITPLGTSVLQKHGGNLAAWQGAAEGTGGHTVNIHNSTGVAVSTNSPGSVQNVHVISNRSEQVLNLAAALEQATPALGLTPQDVERAAGLVRDLRASAEVADTEPERAKGFIEAAKEIAVAGTASALGTGIVALGNLALGAF